LGASASKTGTEVDIPFGPFNYSDIVPVDWADGTNMNFLQTGYFYCEAVVRNNPFGGSTPYALLSIALPSSGTNRYYFADELPFNMKGA